MSTQATYIGANSAQFATGTAGYISDATSRRVWFSRRADGSDGCYVHPSDVVVASDADLVECPRCGELAPIGGDCPGASCTAFRTWAAAHQDDPQGEAAESPRSAGDGSAEPFCACARRWSECDGSRAGCHKATMGRATPRSPRARRRTDTARRLQHPPTCPPSSPSPCSTLAILRASLAAAERRLAAANDEADAAQEAFDLAVASLTEAYQNLDATTANVRTSACAGRAWDVDVTLLDVDGSVVAEGEATLVVGERDGRPSSWGVVENWVSHGLLVLLSDHPGLCDLVAAAARTAIESSGVAHSPEHDR